MTAKLYAAPLEGVTTYIWRRVHHDIFGGVEKYFTPFVSPNANCDFQTKEWDELRHNEGLPVVPQIITNRAAYFIWAAREMQKLGYHEVNFNLGCPSGTVAAKHKGAGMLAYPEELDACLDEIFNALPDMKISVKTRIGKEANGEWERILDIYNQYPISELIVHPRIQKEFYRGQANREIYHWTKEHTNLPLIYNGDVFTADDSMLNESAVMLGRGLVTDPALARRMKGGKAASREELRRYHDTLLEAYTQRMSGDAPCMHRMWELWHWMIGSFDGAEKCMKKMRKAKRLSEYCSIAHTILDTYPLAETPLPPTEK